MMWRLLSTTNKQVMVMRPTVFLATYVKCILKLWSPKLGTTAQPKIPGTANHNWVLSD